MIDVFKPVIGEQEIENVLDALQIGEISGSKGSYLEEFEKRFADYCGVRYGVAVSSGTAALHLAMVVSGVRRGDEVMVSALTNIASGNAVMMTGAQIVPVDSELDTGNMNPDLLAMRLTQRTKAIMPVHLYGHPVDMMKVLGFARKHGLMVIEDCAEAHGAEIAGRRVGSWGHMSCFSFYANKVITTGEGGMVVTDDLDLANELRLRRNLAFTEPRFYHEKLGFNYRMTNLQAAVGCGQMDRIDTIVERKREIASLYTELLKEVPGLQLPVEKKGFKNIYWMYTLVLTRDFPVTRNELMTRFKAAGIETRTMFCPLNIQPVYRDGAVRPVPCPVAERLWLQGLYLPSSLDITSEEQSKVAEVVMSCM